MGNDNYYKDEHKSIVIDKVKAIVKPNGYTTVSFAIDECKLGKEFMSDAHKLAFIKSVSSLIIKDYKYTRDEIENDYEISISPTYGVTKKNKRLAIWALIISGAVALLRAAEAFGWIRIPKG